MAREIDDQSAAESTAGETGAGTTRSDLDAVFGGHPQEIGRFNRRAREGDRGRLDAVDRSVNRIQTAGEHIGAHFAARSLERPPLRILQFGHPVILSAPTTHRGTGHRVQGARP